jgi:hypothetical protein
MLVASGMLNYFIAKWEGHRGPIYVSRQVCLSMSNIQGDPKLRPHSRVETGITLEKPIVEPYNY